MSHLSKQEFNHIVEEALRWYERDNDAGADTAQQYLEAFKAARLKQPKKSSSQSAASSSVLDPEALDNYEAARLRANLASDDKEKIFVEKLKADLRKQFTIEDPVFTVINRIEQHIQQLRSPATWFQYSAEAKIAALEALKQTLLTRTEGTIGEIIESWEKVHKDTIASSRNLFKGKAQDLDTNTVTLINDLKLKYGNESLSLPEDSDSSLSRKDKQKIYQPFLNYIQARTSWLQQLITFIFRNRALSEDKLVFAQSVMEDIQLSDDSYKTLAMLQAKRTVHAEMSEGCKKFHNNLRTPTDNSNESTLLQQPPQYEDSYALMAALPQQQRKTTPSFWQRYQEVMKEGTSSDLAEAFHESIASMRN